MAQWPFRRVYSSIWPYPAKYAYHAQQNGTVKYYAQIHLQVWQNSVCTGQGNLPLITR